ncbi:dTMP kinase [Micromonospora sp. CPCC 206061]|uniref:dTMP kinase n=1 Tax=Micromonospora sp. CPCC 206061 TaxID=3122410 RepID=UPI002FEF2F5F
MTSLFIAVEGPNGVGKTTIATRLATRLQDRTGGSVHLTTEPTDTPLGRLLRASESVLHGRPLALTLAADRAAHVESEVIPALDNGRHVVTDRYVQSSMVLQRVDGLDLDEIWAYNQYVLPATSIYLEDEPQVITGRLGQRTSLTRLEIVGSPRRELELYREARQFLGSEDWQQHVIDCHGKDPDRVVTAILDCLKL